MTAPEIRTLEFGGCCVHLVVATMLQREQVAQIAELVEAIRQMTAVVDLRLGDIFQELRRAQA